MLLISNTGLISIMLLVFVSLLLLVKATIKFLFLPSPMSLLSVLVSVISL